MGQEILQKESMAQYSTTLTLVISYHELGKNAKIQMMNKVRVGLFLFTVLFVIGVGWFISLFARGYKFDTKTLLRPSGLLVIESEPSGAQIIIDGELESATKDSLSLNPGVYQVEIKKDGFLTWRKTLTIKKEEVTQANVYLFPAAPSLSPLTFTGVERPVLSPDRTKIAYGIPVIVGDEQRAGIWVRDLVDLPIGFSREPRQITNLPPGEVLVWAWSPDSRELLLRTQTQTLLLPISEFTPRVQLVSVGQNVLNTSVRAWETEVERKNRDLLGKLPIVMRDLLQENTVNYVFSPDEKKVLYTADAELTIPAGLISALPGSSTQEEERDIKIGRTYIYDIREDRNFLIFTEGVDINNKTALDVFNQEGEPQEKGPSASLYWFPTSAHVILAQENRIIILDYDGTNGQIVYGGPYQAPYAIPYPNASRLLFLTNLGAGEDALPNLYTLILK